MAVSLLQPPTDATPQVAFAIKKQAPEFLKSQRSLSLPWPLKLFVNSESQEKWQIYENVFLSCLRTGDDQSAYLCLEELTDRFGVENDRVLALRGLFKEGTAKSQQELQTVMQQYEDMLKEDPSVFSVRKRRAALMRSMGKTTEAINALTYIVDTVPTDAEAWSELSDVYLSQGAIDQAVYCLEEVLVITPNAWNMHARLGEVLFLSASRTENAEDQVKALRESMRRFCRSLELCDNYLRGFYGLKLTTDRLVQILPTLGSADTRSGEPGRPSLATVKQLNVLATAKLAEILRKSSAGEKGWDGYSQLELLAARELLDQGTPKIDR